jgi:hypothetical protein
MALIKMCMNGTCCNVHTGKDLSNESSIEDSLKLGDVLSLFAFNFVLEYTIRDV